MEPIRTINSETISRYIDPIVERFYRKCHDDFLIGYYFQRQPNFFTLIVPQLKLFWKSDLEKIMGLSQSHSLNKFNLNIAHQTLNLKKGEIGRWAVLFLETLNESPTFPISLLVVWEKRIIFYRNLFWKKFSKTN